MRRSFLLPYLLAVITLLAVCLPNASAQSQKSTPALTNADIVLMVKTRLSPDIIIAKIQGSKCNFDTSPAALERLKSAGVPNDVILAMVKGPVKTTPRGIAASPNSPQATAPVKAGARQAATTTEVAGPSGGRSLWMAKFTGETKATAAIAAVQQGDEAALRQSSLFKEVTSFASQSIQPAGTWSLSAKEVSYSGGSAVKRAILGFGTGRAHIVMVYKLRNPHGHAVWTKKIKTEPPLWGSNGVIGSIQNQSASTNKQPAKLVDALSKFFSSQN